MQGEDAVVVGCAMTLAVVVVCVMVVRSVVVTNTHRHCAMRGPPLPTLFSLLPSPLSIPQPFSVPPFPPSFPPCCFLLSPPPLPRPARVSQASHFPRYWFKLLHAEQHRYQS